MPIVHVPVQLTVEHLIAAVKQLPPAELHEFEQRFAKWQKRNGTRTNEEAKLLACIKANSRLPAVDQRRYERLRQKHIAQGLVVRPLVCASGVCLTCAMETRSGPKLTCRDGPVFEIGEIV